MDTHNYEHHADDGTVTAQTASFPTDTVEVQGVGYESVTAGPDDVLLHTDRPGQYIKVSRADFDAVGYTEV